MTVEAGSIVEGVVTGIAKFGAFVELEDKKVGLVHISEVANAYVSDINEFLKVGETVKVKVVSLDDRGKIALSIKQVLPREERPEPKRERPVHREDRRGNGGFQERRFAPRKPAGPMSFEDQLSRFLKDSDERLNDLKRNTESKRGGRGARRSD